MLVYRENNIHRAERRHDTQVGNGYLQVKAINKLVRSLKNKRVCKLSSPHRRPCIETRLNIFPKRHKVARASQDDDWCPKVAQRISQTKGLDSFIKIFTLVGDYSFLLTNAALSRWNKLVPLKNSLSMTLIRCFASVGIKFVSGEANFSAKYNRMVWLSWSDKSPWRRAGTWCCGLICFDWSSL